MSGFGRRSSALGGPLEGWQVASKGLGPLPRRRGSALALSCGRGGRGTLPLPRAAAVSTGRSVRLAEEGDAAPRVRLEPVGEVGLVAPVVEERDVALALRPALGREERRELVELEVGVEEGDGLVRGRG